MKKLFASALLSISLWTSLTPALAPVVSAQEVVSGPSNSANNLPVIKDESDIFRIIKRITNWMYTGLLSVAVIMILYAAFIYMTSGGGEEVGKAHKMVMYAIVAIAVALLSRGVSFIVAELLGVPSTAIPDSAKK